MLLITIWMSFRYLLDRPSKLCCVTTLFNNFSTSSRVTFMNVLSIGWHPHFDLPACQKVLSCHVRLDLIQMQKVSFRVCVRSKGLWRSCTIRPSALIWGNKSKLSTYCTAEEVGVERWVTDYMSAGAYESKLSCFCAKLERCWIFVAYALQKGTLTQRRYSKARDENTSHINKSLEPC